MQLETVDFASFADTWGSQPNHVPDDWLVPPPGELDETYPVEKNGSWLHVFMLQLMHFLSQFVKPAILYLLKLEFVC